VKNTEIPIDIYDLFKIMSDNHIILFYQGLFDQEMIKSVVSMTEKKLIEENIDEMIRRRIFNVMIEGLQNICKHQTKDDGVTENPFLIIGKKGERFNVVTGNCIPNNKVAPVSHKIDFINSLNKEELKELYKKSRLNSVISEVGGAGLGFIDMARKSGNKLEYRFYTLDTIHSFFVLNNTITNN